MRPPAVSMGDPAGVGLELAARVWAERAEGEPAPFLFVGDPEAFARAGARLRLPAAAWSILQSEQEFDPLDPRLPVIPVALAEQETPGAPSPANAAAAVAAIERGVEAARAGQACALVTLPVAKAVLNRSGFAFPGHTEFLAHLLAQTPWPHARGPVMLLAAPPLRVALVTVHEPLRSVPSLLTIERIAHVGRVLGEAMARDFGIAAPRIAVCGLNPHAGEGGMIGREERDIINPAAALLRSEGWNVSDARPADALFHDAARASYDAAIALYHDQGLIPIKALYFWDAVNATLGLPIVRTSPDHGTAFDIAGKGVARADSFRAALALARAMARRRQAA